MTVQRTLLDIDICVPSNFDPPGSAVHLYSGATNQYHDSFAGQKSNLVTFSPTMGSSPNFPLVEWIAPKTEGSLAELNIHAESNRVPSSCELQCSGSIATLKFEERRYCRYPGLDYLSSV